jgi:hypothetical protein
MGECYVAVQVSKTCLICVRRRFFEIIRAQSFGPSLDLEGKAYVQVVHLSRNVYAKVHQSQDGRVARINTVLGVTVWNRFLYEVLGYATERFLRKKCSPCPT